MKKAKNRSLTRRSRNQTGWLWNTGQPLRYRRSSVGVAKSWCCQQFSPEVRKH